MSEVNIASQVTVIEANRTIKDALMEQLKSSRPRKRISVTDLLNVKQAFFRRKYPDIKPPLEKQEVMWAGTGFHELFGAAVSREEYLEQFVEWEGITGKIDIFKNVPVEVKTTSGTVDESDLVRRRPGYLEQLGMYCGMVGKTEGELIVYHRAAVPLPSPLSVFHVRFSDLLGIREEMMERRDLLLRALAADDSSILPRCPWLSFSCDYSSVCDCPRSTIQSSRRLISLVSEVTLDTSVARSLYQKLAERDTTEGFNLNDIVFPRKAFILRQQRDRPGARQAQAEAGERLASLDQRGFRAVVEDAVRYGLPGGTEEVSLSLGAVSGRTQVNQGMPVIVRGSNLSYPVARERLLGTSSHYFLRLGFECALLGEDRTKGRLIIYYRNAATEDAKLMVYDVSFSDPRSLRAEAARRAELLATASNVTDLPACPSWMCRYCKYESVCQTTGEVV